MLNESSNEFKEELAQNTSIRRTVNSVRYDNGYDID